MFAVNNFGLELNLCVHEKQQTTFRKRPSNPVMSSLNIHNDNSRKLEHRKVQIEAGSDRISNPDVRLHAWCRT